ncbi:preprotein translocase subunit SecE [candidate division KSB1 bacterium]|nr:preprotein translocase subunit SecE [candidate division KSB1 bacterium]NIR70253.1 preprotein translocase subunit SecE [candidate division KSB1 bacterium]NIS26524.1 preprotein translocase subunit SecE [candidate division KSB1 bacterium]NIT73286.1 preprotein translocase subunit SecE [candidate division KSB1 bacterium]NIU23910.1 preprotein translocase subunit SecE [candidate division KSB1 bacterium]
MKLLEKPVKFISDVNQEMSKVNWPTYDDLKSSTVIVIVISIFFALYVFVSDRILQNIIQLIF